MNQTTMRRISLVFLATLACGTAMAKEPVRAPGRHIVVPLRAEELPAAAFGTNLYIDPCTGCSYDAVAGGYYLWGSQNCESPGTTQWLAVSFISHATGVPRRIKASINLDPACTSTSNEVSLGIWTDACGIGPAVKLVEGKATVPAEPCAIATTSLRDEVTLTFGTKYWVVAETVGPAQNGLSAIWYASNGAQIGGNVASGGWFQFSGLTPGFRVQ
jgi:hypothetical protein